MILYLLEGPPAPVSSTQMLNRGPRAQEEMLEQQSLKRQNARAYLLGNTVKCYQS